MPRSTQYSSWEQNSCFGNNQSAEPSTTTATATNKTRHCAHRGICWDSCTSVTQTPRHKTARSPRSRQESSRTRDGAWWTQWFARTRRATAPCCHAHTPCTLSRMTSRTPCTRALQRHRRQTGRSPITEAAAANNTAFSAGQSQSFLSIMKTQLKLSKASTVPQASWHVQRSGAVDSGTPRLQRLSRTSTRVMPRRRRITNGTIRGSATHIRAGAGEHGEPANGADTGRLAHFYQACARRATPQRRGII